MPSTTDERIDLMDRWFSGELDPTGPEDVLLAQGFTISPGWTIRKPSPSHTMTYEQFELVAFLVQEWDYDFHKEAP